MFVFISAISFVCCCHNSAPSKPFIIHHTPYSVQYVQYDRHNIYYYHETLSPLWTHKTPKYNIYLTFPSATNWITGIRGQITAQNWIFICIDIFYCYAAIFIFWLAACKSVSQFNDFFGKVAAANEAQFPQFVPNDCYQCRISFIDDNE